MAAAEKVLDMKVLKKIHTGVLTKEKEGFHPENDGFGRFRNPIVNVLKD